MAETLIWHALDFSGETSLRIYLRKNDGTLVNTGDGGGDALNEVDSTGVFAATLNESRTGLGSLAVRICDGAEFAANLIWDGFLHADSVVVGAPVGGLTSEQQAHLTYIAAQAAKLTTATVSIIDSVLPGGTIRTFLRDDDVGTYRIPIKADDPEGTLKTYLQSNAVTAIGFGAGRNSVPDLILGSIDKNSITGPDVNDVITIPVTITAADKNAREGTFTWQIRVTDADGNHTKLQGPLILRPNYRTM